MTTDTDNNAETELHNTVGPDIAASKEDREEAARIIDVIESLDTLTKEDLYEEYEQKYPNTKTFNDERTTGGLEKKYRPAALDLPGFGEKRETCGKPIPHICDCCGEKINIGATCGQSMCPRCAPKWVLKTAPGIVNNIMGAARMMSANNGNDAVYKHHAVISPPEDLYIDAEYPEQELISIAQEFMDEIDMQGIAVYHPWSGKPDEEADDAVLDEAEEFKESHDGDIGEWKKRLFEGRDWYGDVREELQHRPHIHLIGACPWFPMGDITKLTHAETGWVIHRITGKRKGNSSISLGDMRSVARAVVYALSHCAIDTRDESGSKGGENNMYVFGKKGKEFLNADDRDLEEAKAKCYSVAPTLLGIDKMETSCREEVPEEETDHSDPADQDALDDLEDDVETSSTDDEMSMTTCHGDLVSIDRADFIDDEDWQQTALFADEAIRAKEEWEADGGWKGWLERQTGQARLPTDGAESVDSPPPG